MNADERGSESEQTPPGSPLATRHSPLSAVQRWLQAVIMHPEGVDAGLASDAARQHLDVAPENIEQVISRSAAQSSVERLAIYADAYFARLLECLGEEFPILRKTFGEETFNAFAFDYLQRYPSQSYTLGKLGENFARYLAETRPTEADEGDLPGDWPEFLIDLATLEWTFNQVFDGPGVEGQTLLTGEQLEQIDAERWPAARLEMVPCLKLLAMRFPVNAYYTALRREEIAELPAPAPSWLAVTRRDFVVRRHELNQRQFELLTALAAGESVGAAIERAAAAPGGDLEQFILDLADWFRDWSANGFFRAVILDTV